MSNTSPSSLPALEHRVSFSDGPEAEWSVLRFTANEQVNALYVVSVDITTAELETDGRALLGAGCELSLQRGEHAPSSFFGLVHRVDQLGYELSHGGPRLALRVHLLPALALAQQRTNSRIWQQRSVQEIVRELLAPTLEPHGRGLALDNLSRGASPRDYCVQYRESDYDFMCRLLQEEGMSFFFVHDAQRGHELLTLADDNRLYPMVENIDGSAVIPIIGHSPDLAAVESVQSIEWSERLTSTSVGTSAFEPASPGAVMTGAWAQPDRRGWERRVYVHGQHRMGADDLDRWAQDLGEAMTGTASRAACQGNASVVRPGHRVVLEGLDDASAPGEWLVLQVQHSSGDQPGSYRCHFECMPADLPLRPVAWTPKPTVYGPQTATVVGGGEIDVDAQGRIQVQMHWQEQPSFAAGASCRVRCAQSWAGPSWGAQFIPRVGMEVVVEFLEGDPDRPLVTGCVYNGANSPPFDLPGNATQSGWRSNSTPGGGGSNELRFEDAAGTEQIYLHGQKDWLIEINRDKGQAIGHDEQLRVGHDRRRQVSHDEQIEIGANQGLSVGADQRQAVGGSQSVSVGADQSLSVGANQRVSVAGSRTETISGSAVETVLVGKAVTVGGALATVVGGAFNSSIGALSAEEVGGIKSVSVGGSSSEQVVGEKRVDAASIGHRARRDLSAQAGANLSLSAGEDLQVSAGGDLGIRAEGKGVIELDRELTIKVGKASITLKKNGEIILDGAKISVKGQKSITLTSKKINHN